MPQIPQYVAQSPGIAAPETGIEAAAMAGRRLGAFYHQTGEELAGAIGSASREAQEYLDHREISHGAVAEAGMLSDLTDKWNAVISAPDFDPNNPVAAQKFRAEVLEPTLDKFQNGFTTRRSQEWADSRTERIRDHFFEKTAADVSSMAGIAAVSNARKLANTYSNLAQRDPSMTREIVGPGGILDGSIDAMIPPTVKGVDRERIKAHLQQVKEEVAKAGAYGAIQRGKDPEKAADDFSRQFPDLINGVEANQIAKAATAQRKANELTARQLLATQKAQATLAAQQDANNIFARNVQADPNNPGKLVINPAMTQEIVDFNHKHAGAPQAETIARTLIDWQQGQLRERREVVNSDPGTRKNLLDNMFNADQPTTQIDILRAEADGKLSGHDAATLRQLQTETESAPLKSPIWHDTLNAVHKSLTAMPPGMTGTDAQGEENYASFVQKFIPEYLKESRAGTLPPNALDLKDPKSLISQSLSPFRRTPAQQLQSLVNRGGGGSITGRPGESIVGGGTSPPQFTPPPNWQWSPSRQQYRDPQGNIWDKNGALISKGGAQPSAVPQSQ